jgi:hypothetical protein
MLEIRMVVLAWNAPRLHQVRYDGCYSNVARAQRTAAELQTSSVSASSSDAEPTASERRRLRGL